MPSALPFQASERLLGRWAKRAAAEPYFGVSLAVHGFLALLLMGMAGLGEAERARASAAEQAHTAQLLAQTEARTLAHRVRDMAAVLQQLSAAQGKAAPALPRTEGRSAAALAQEAEALWAAIEREQRQLRAAAFARLTGLPLEQAQQELVARAAKETPPPAAASPAEAIAQLASRAQEALQAQRAQLEVQRSGVPVARAAAPSSPPQSRPADGIPRSLAVQLAAEFRLGGPRGRVGEPGFEAGYAVNPRKVEGVLGGSGQQLGRVAHAISPSPSAAPALEAAARATESNKGAGRVIGPGGAWASRVYLDSWYVIGPFEARGAEPLETPYPPERDLDLDGVYLGQGGRLLRWQYTSRGFYPFLPPDRAEHAIYYAATELRLAEAGEVTLEFAADDAARLWLNDRPIWTSAPGDKPWLHPPYYLPDEQVASLALAEGQVRLKLAAGTHRLLLKLLNHTDRTFFSVVLAR